MLDCGFTNDSNWFRYRVGVIIVEDDCVLLAKNEIDDYYYSVGGGVHLNEKAEDAVRREVFEETGVNYEVDRLVVIHENFFDGDGCILGGFKCHEIALFYTMKPRGTKEIHSDSYTHGIKENMYWIPIVDLDNHIVFPSWLKDYLSKEHDSIEHIVTDERMISRICQMEKYFDDVLLALKYNPESINTDDELQKMILDLKNYSANGQWLKDYEADERGELPKELKRGVLSQDGLHNLLCELHEKLND